MTVLRVLVAFAAVGLFGRGTSANLAAVLLTVSAIALDALDGYLARKKHMATPLGAQLDMLGDRLIEYMFFTYFAVVGMVPWWLPVLFFTRGATTDFLRSLALKAGYSGWDAEAMERSGWGRALVASRPSRALYAALKCACFCYLGLELALTRGPVAWLGTISSETHLAMRTIAQILTWATAGFCLLRGLPVVFGGWRFLAREAARGRTRMSIAFFDIDGTLLPNPSLELRFLWDLFRRGRIPCGNCFRWAVRTLRLAVSNPPGAVLANKMYLRGLSRDIFHQIGDGPEPLLPEFFPAAIERVWWHTLRGDAIVLVSGTLVPLAEMVRAALERELLWRGVKRKIAVLATRVELQDGCCTGQVDGAAMFGAAKASAIAGFAEKQGITLEQCSAYGDHVTDFWMLAAVGNAVAVNPRPGLCRAAHLHGWRVVDWQAARSRKVRDALRLKGRTAP